jgi:hypothetical protein
MVGVRLLLRSVEIGVLIGLGVKVGKAVFVGMLRAVNVNPIE